MIYFFFLRSAFIFFLRVVVLRFASYLLSSNRITCNAEGSIFHLQQPAYENIMHGFLAFLDHKLRGIILPLFSVLLFEDIGTWILAFTKQEFMQFNVKHACHFYVSMEISWFIKNLVLAAIISWKQTPLQCHENKCTGWCFNYYELRNFTNHHYNFI